MNFTKPNTVTIRYTNSQWLRENGSEVPVGRGPVPKTGQKPPSPRGDAPEVPVGSAAVPKDGQEPPLSRENATEASVGRVAVAKSGQSFG
ncbi:MAG: hypothetical protein PUH82_02670 [Bacteroidales bacterium]|nr:hypothetical protein [Bacteroidales bacterium]